MGEPANWTRKEDRVRGPIIHVAQQEARAALDALLAEHPNGLPVPDLRTAHSVIYQRVEETWCDAQAGDYLTVQSKLAVIRLLGHYTGVDAAIKVAAKAGKNRVQPESEDDVSDATRFARHLEDLGLVVVKDDEAKGKRTPRVTIDLGEGGDAPHPEGGSKNASVARR